MQPWGSLLAKAASWSYRATILALQLRARYARQVARWEATDVFGRLTDASRRALVRAQGEARRLDSGIIGTEHLLLGLIAEEQGIAAEALSSLDLTVDAVRKEARKALLVPVRPGGAGSPPFSPRMKRVLDRSLRQALSLGAESLGPEHLLLGLVDEGEGVGAQILVGMGVDLATVRQRVVQLLADTHGDGGMGRLTQRVVPPELLGAPREPPRQGRGQMPAGLAACSFCGAGPSGSGQLISGDNAFICETCVRKWSRRLGPP
jgi:Clp amino terminal domain, pathogenicity island component/ClpX C4-type zinc finger